MTPLPRPTMWRAAAVATGEARRDRLGDRLHDVADPHVDKRRALDVVVEGGVEADIDAAALVRHRRGMPLDRVPVHRIENSDVRNPALVPDAVGDILERGCDRGADGAPAPVDDRDAVLQQHYSSAFHLSRTSARPRYVRPREIPDFIGTNSSGVERQLGRRARVPDQQLRGIPLLR
ncbi:hypothetical protein [Rhodococcus opacus]|uniref:hypothetical protein n=1 Tax=Rhodococcus opacus TaxID=37919 RepID=UPI00211F2E98|nr:hypothetical protein [Rhodococcus opacus]